MVFASLGSWWLFLSLPLIISLYLLKRRYTDTLVSSHLLWQRVLREQEASRPWQRLRRQLLLLLQLLAAALMVFGLLQPAVPLAGQAKAHVLFVLDASASMQAEDTPDPAGQSDDAPQAGAGTAAAGQAGAASRFEQAKAAIVRFARERAAGSEYSLLLMRGQPELVLQRQAGALELQRALDQAQPFYGQTAYRETLSLASALTRGDAGAEVRVYTDGQWPENVDGLHFDAPVHVERIAGGAAAGNVSIVQFGVKALPAAAGVTGQSHGQTAGDEQQAIAVLKNWGAQPAVLEAVVYADERADAVRKVTLQAGERQTIYWERLRGASVYRLDLAAPDALAADNTAFAFAATGSQRKLAVYAGAGNLFLEKALALAGVDVLKTQKGADGVYAPPAERQPDFVVLDGVAASEVAGDGWQRLLASKPLWRFPALQPQAGTAPASPPYTVADHPVTRYIRFDNVNIAGVQPLAGGPQLTALASAADGRPLLAAGLEAGQPQLAFAFALAQSDLPLRTEFPVLVQNAALWLTAQAKGSLGQTIAGSRLAIAVHPEAVSASWTPASAGAVGMPAEASDGSVAAQQTVPAVPGLYRFAEQGAGGSELQHRWLAVTMDPREADVNARTDWAAPPSAATAGAAAGSGSALPQAAAAAGAAVPLLPWVVALLLLLLIWEWEVYRRGHAV